MTNIQQTIASYMAGKSAPSEHDLLCFVGMIETGEATYADFVAVGGEELAKAVGEKRSAITRRVWRMGQSEAKDVIAKLEAIAEASSLSWNFAKESLERPNWDAASRFGWEYYVSGELKELWDDLPHEAKLVAYICADRDCNLDEPRDF